MKCLVTGGAGFIGSHIVDLLIEEGHTVVTVDRELANNPKFYWNRHSINVFGDITDYDFMKHVFNDVDYVFHLAAESRLQPAIESPLWAMKQNVMGTTTVLQCAREAGVKRVVFSSTSSVYGLRTPPNNEKQKEDCLNPYSVSKFSAEKVCKMYSDLYGLDTASLRYFNVFGERSPDKGQYAPVISIFQRQLMEDGVLTIVGDGSQRRDFVYVKDVARANLMVALHPQPLRGEVFNVGSGKNYSILEIASLISDKHTFIPPREGEAETTLSDISKITSQVGWQPKTDVIEWIHGQRQEQIDIQTERDRTSLLH